MLLVEKVLSRGLNKCYHYLLLEKENIEIITFLQMKNSQILSLGFHWPETLEQQIQFNFSVLTEMNGVSVLSNRIALASNFYI